MNKRRYEKSLDNRCAALVSREPRAPRAGEDRKPFTVNELRLMSPLTVARGAQVSRAAREHPMPFSGRACPPLYALSVDVPRLRMPRPTGAQRENGVQRLASKDCSRREGAALARGHGLARSRRRRSDALHHAGYRIQRILRPARNLIAARSCGLREFPALLD